MKQSLRGKLIVLYGINNLGKTTQAKMLVDKLMKEGVTARYLKYPIYDLLPTGPKINKILRGGKNQNISEEDFQAFYAQNRRDFEPKLKEILNSGTWIVAEDYIGTGLAWGVSKGEQLEILEEQNKNLRHEDIAILLDGKRFLEGKETRHLHESDDSLMERCKKTHQELGKKYGWITVNASQTIKKVHNDIWQNIMPTLAH